MSTDSRIEAAQKHIQRTEEDIARQKKIIEDLRRDGRTTRGAETLLDLFLETLRAHEQTLALLRQFQEL